MAFIRRGFPRGFFAVYSVDIGSGPLTTGTLLTASVTGLQGGEVVTYQWTDDGVNITGATASTYTATIGTDGIADASSIRCVVTIDGQDYTSSSRQITAASSAPTISIDSIGPQDATTGAVPFEYTLDTDDTVEFLLVRSSASNPVAGDFNGGQSGPDVHDLGPVALTAAGSTGNLTGPNGINGDWRLWALTTGSTTPVSSAVVTIDSRAVVLSSPTGTQTGSTTADGSVSADRAFGTLYAGAWPTSAPPADDAAIEAGTGATYHTSAATASGVNNFSATGLTASTEYRWHFVVRYPSDQLGTSAQSAAFTTAAGSSIEFATAGFGEDTASGATASITATGATLGAAVASRQFLCWFSGRMSGVPVAGDWQARAINGAVTQTTELFLDAPSRFAVQIGFVIDLPTGTGTDDFIFELNGGAQTIDGGTFSIIRMTDNPTLTVSTVEFNAAATGGAPETLTPSININANDGVFLSAACHISPGVRALGAGTISWSSATSPAPTAIIDGGSFNGGGSTAIVEPGSLPATTPYQATATFDELVAGNDSSALIVRAS